MPNSPLPVAVGAAIIIQRGKILLTQRQQHKRLGGYWEFPGGKLEEGETPQQALARELREELDITIAVGALLTTVYHRYDWGSALILAYRCRYLEGTLKHLEVVDHSWVEPRDLLNYDILPADRPIIELLQRGTI
jgi:8-oxo-dGTP diphosphatase